MNTKYIEPLPGHVVLKLKEGQEETYGSIIIPDTGKEKAEIAIVIASRETYNYNTDKFVYSNLSPGDEVIIPKMGIQTVTLNGEEFLVCQENQLLGIVRTKETQ
jgi:chaperonin GroES